MKQSCAICLLHISFRYIVIYVCIHMKMASVHNFTILSLHEEWAYPIVLFYMINILFINFILTTYANTCNTRRNTNSK